LNRVGIAEHADVVVDTSLMPLLAVILIIFIILLCMLCVELAAYRRYVAAFGFLLFFHYDLAIIVNL